MLVFNMHLNISWYLWAVSTLWTAPGTIRVFVNHCSNLRVQLCKTIYLWCRSVWFLRDFLFGQKRAQYGHENPPDWICLDSTWLAQLDFFFDKNPQIRHSHPSRLLNICFIIAVSNSTNEPRSIQSSFITKLCIIRATLRDMLSQGIPGWTMFAAIVANDARMINYVPSFNVHSQIYLLPESMITIWATIFRIAYLHNFGINDVV